MADIIIVGRVTAKHDETMRTLLEINDNSGSFKVIFYQKGENEVPIALKNFEYQQFMYVKVFGTIRVFKEEKAIVGTHIKKIEKFDEVTNHMLNVFVAHCIRKKGILTNRELGPQGQNTMSRASGAMGPSAGQGMGGGRMEAGSGDAKQLIFNVMKDLSKSNKFIHKSDIYNVLQQKMSLHDFEGALNRLQEDNVIYEGYSNDIFSIQE